MPGLRLNPLVANASSERYGPILRLAGDPDFINLATAQHYGPPGAHVVAAMREAVGAGAFGYGAIAGETSLREAIAEKVRRRNGIDADPRTEIRVTNGAGHAFLMTLMAFLSPGDEVISADPSFPLNWYASQLLGARVIGCPIDGPDGFDALPEGIARAVGPRTKALLIHPVNNPTGQVLSRRTAERIADLAERHDLLVLSDEVYEWFTYDGCANVSIASLPGLKQRTATIYGFSKEYNLPGLRVGYVVASEPISRAIGLIQSNGPVGASVPGQYGALAALRGPHDALERLVAELAETRRSVVARLNSMPGVTCRLPEGGFFVFPDMSGVADVQNDLYVRLARDAKIGVAPGSWYGSRGHGHVRISYGSVPSERVGAFLDRLASFVTDQTPVRT